MKHRAHQPREAAAVVKWRETEAQLSAAYVRLRKILGAFDTPPAPTGPQVWEHTEQCAREVVAALRELVDAGQCCELASVGKAHNAGCLASKVVQRIDRFGGGSAAEESNR